MRQEIFRMERVTYMERGVAKLEDFHLQIYRGEIMGLVPVNAHGMTAFLKLLQTNLPIDDGYVYYCGELVNSWKESKKNPNRISIIKAQSCLVERLTVSDNIFVLRQGFRQRIIRPSLLKRQLEPFLQDIGMDILADSYVEKLTVFERVVVELLRAVIMGNRLIVLNEIGALISDRELAKLHEILRHYAAQGIAFIYISPHFEEILQISDRAAMLTNGRIQKVIQEPRMEKEELRDCAEEYDRMVREHLENCGKSSDKRKVLLSARGITSGSIQKMDMDIYAGECVVLQHQDHETFRDMIDLLTGERRAKEGYLQMDGMLTKLQGNWDIAVIQERATESMIFPKLDYMDNLCMGLAQRIPSLWLDPKIVGSIRREYGPVLGEEVFSMHMEELSERQKYQLVYTRILLQRPRVICCIQPFQGADLPHRMFIWKLLEMFLEKGITVVILALNLADSISLADRLVRIENNGMVEEITRENFGSLSSDVPWRYLYREKEDKSV